MATTQESEPPSRREPDAGLAPDGRNGVSGAEEPVQDPDQHNDAKLNYYKPNPYEQQHPAAYDSGYGFPYGVQQQQADPYHYPQYPRPGGYPSRPAGNAYPPYGMQGARFPTPTLNQLLQPGAPPATGHRFPYGEYQQQQQNPAWPHMQQPRGYPPQQHNMQYKAPLAAQGAAHSYPYGLPPNSQPGYAPTPPATSAASAQDGSKENNDSSTAVSASGSSSSSPSPVVSAASAGASAALSPNNTSAGGATAAAAAAASAPSPAPSPASRSMSPALGQGNNTSPSGQADSTGPTRTTQSPMAAQGAYQHPMPPPPHVGMSPYKMGGGPGSPATSMGPYASQQPQQYPYMPRPPMVPSPYGPNAGSYGPPPPAGATPPANNANSVSPGPPRPPIPPHMGPPPPNPYGSYPPSSVGGTPPGMNQYPQQPSWGPPPNAPHPGAPPGHQGPLPGGKNMPMVGSRPHTPTHYNLKQHIQAKMGYNMAPSPTSGAPPSAQPPLPQQLMGPYPPPNGSAMNNSGLPSPGMGGPPQGHPPSASSPVANVVTTGPDGAPLDDGSQQSTLSNTSAASGDDQSMPSTPRSRKEGGAPGQGPLSSGPPGPGTHHPHTFSHPPTPQSSVASPGAASSTHEDYGDVHSPAPGPNWNIPNRAAPPSPVCNSHTGSDPYKKKSGGPGDAMARLYEFDDNPERKVFVDRLLRFMEEKGSPIAACPTISKNPLDLFRLYHLVRDRGGFLEVTKAKSWKDVASALGIGASSSAAYTLRKHYTKNLLPFECKFDRGGIDPRPLIDQVETSAKKKPVTKGGLSVPSPAGSSNSQDSFPPPMDGYSNYPGYPPQSHMADNLAASNPFDDQYNRGGGVPNSYPPPPPPSVYNNMGVRPNYPNQAPYSSYQNDYPQQPQPGQPYPPYPGPPPQNRSMYGAPYPEPYGHQGPPPPGGGAPPPAGWGAAPGYPPRHPAPPAANVGPPSASAAAPPPPATTAATSQAPPQQPTTPQPPQQQQSSSAGPSPSASPAPSAPASSFPEQNDQYQKSGLRQLLASSTIAQQLAATPADRTGYPGNQQQPGQPPYQPNMARPNSAAPAPNMPPRGSTPTPAGAPPPGPIQQGPYPGYGPPAQPQTGQPPRPGYAWRGAAPYGNQYPPQGSSPSPMQTGTGPWVPPTGAPPAPRPAGTWDSQQRFNSPAAGSAGAPPQTYNGAPQQWGPSMPNARPYPPMARPPYRPDGKPYAMPPVPVKPGYGQPIPGAPQSMGSMYSVKRDVYFPADSVEAIVPVHAKRRRLGKGDVAPVDAWRIFLALKSGLLAESTWAIDVLNILLFDDSTVSYFGLAYLPGLLEVVLEHFRRCLAEIFGILEDMEICYDRVEEYRAKSDPKDSKKADEKDEESWWLVPKRSRQRSAPTYDLGSVKARDLVGERVKVLDSQSVVALNVKRGEKVGVVNRDNEVFVLDTRKDWDVYDGFDSGVERWQMGGGDTTQHIVTHFQAELGIVPFVRVLEDKRMKSTSSEQGTRANEQTTNQTADDSAKVQGSVLDKSIEETVSNIKQEQVDNAPSENEPPAADVPKAEPNKTEERRKEFMLQIRDLHGSLKRRRMEDYEDECYVKDESSLTLVTDTQDNLSRRSIALSNILRSLSFVPGNENELAKNATLLVIIGKLLLLYHDHNLRSTNQKNYDREEDVDFFGSDTSATSNQSSQTKPETEWWWDTLLALRENALVLLANVAGQLDLSQYSEEIARPIVDGLLHWAVCPSAQAQDPFPSFGPHSTSLLSPNRLSLEALCKLCVVESNTDLILATPPFSRLEKLVSLLTRYLCRTEDQVLREFAINLLYNFSAADSGMARLIALSNNSMALLVAFVEQAEGNALAIATQHGIQALRENPEAMGTSLDMLRRAAWTLYHISSHPDSRQLLAKLEQRLLALVMSQIMDQSVAALLAKSLYLCNSDGD